MVTYCIIEQGVREIKWRLDYCEGIVARLLSEGGPWATHDTQINDRIYPVVGEGSVEIRFRLIRGYRLLKTYGIGLVHDLKRYCAEQDELRFPNAAEALLPVSRDKKLGACVYHHLVACLPNSTHMFVVFNVMRGRSIIRKHSYEEIDPRNDYLFVCNFVSSDEVCPD